MRYLKKLGNVNPKFGTRDMSQAEIDFFMTATVPAEQDPEKALYDLIKRANALCDQVLHEEFPKAFAAAREAGVEESLMVSASEEVFTIPSTTVSAPAEEF